MKFTNEQKALRVKSNLAVLGISIELGGDYPMLLRRFRSEVPKASVEYKIYETLLKAPKAKLSKLIDESILYVN